MEWSHAIERNRLPLLRIVAALFALIGLEEGNTVERLAWPLYRAVLKVLRPAEAAVRRLIVVAARDMVVKPAPIRQARPERKVACKGKGKGRGKTRLSFQLCDPRPRSSRPWRPAKGQRPEPRIRFIDVGFDPTRRPWSHAPVPAAPPPPPKDSSTAAAKSLCRRLLAIKAALEDLAYQARRYARWRAKPVEERRPKLASALRSSPAPGHRRKPSHEVDDILTECQWLVREAEKPNTS